MKGLALLTQPAGGRVRVKVKLFLCVCFIGLCEVLPTLWCSVPPDFSLFAMSPCLLLSPVSDETQTLFVPRVCLGRLRTLTFPVTLS